MLQFCDLFSFVMIFTWKVKHFACAKVVPSDSKMLKNPPAPMHAADKGATARYDFPGNGCRNSLISGVEMGKWRLAVSSPAQSMNPEQLFIHVNSPGLLVLWLVVSHHDSLSFPWLQRHGLRSNKLVQRSEIFPQQHRGESRATFATSQWKLWTLGKSVWIDLVGKRNRRKTPWTPSDR